MSATARGQERRMHADLWLTNQCIYQSSTNRSCLGPTSRLVCWPCSCNSTAYARPTSAASNCLTRLPPVPPHPCRQPNDERAVSMR